MHRPDLGKHGSRTPEQTGCAREEGIDNGFHDPLAQQFTIVAPGRGLRKRHQVHDGHTEEELTWMVDRIRPRISAILERATKEQRPPADVAATMARETVLAAR